jgi:major membrane immunogen (membrane-anchored lipoprotein)
MKTLKNLILLSILTLGLVAFTVANRESYKVASEIKSDSSSNYLDGTYMGHSRAIYSSEPYWGHVEISVNGGVFTGINFTIRDSNLHEVVDSMYGVIHYAGNPEYMQQCVNDGHGIELYPQRLLESQNIDNIDAITGATWSYTIFIASTHDALKDAQRPTAINEVDVSSKIGIRVQPNPFTTILNLEYFLANDIAINLSIYDSQGKLVNQLVDKKQNAGHYTLSWGDYSPRGIYFYRLSTDQLTVSSKIVKL